MKKLIHQFSSTIKPQTIVKQSQRFILTSSKKPRQFDLVNTNKRSRFQEVTAKHEEQKEEKQKAEIINEKGGSDSEKQSTQGESLALQQLFEDYPVLFDYVLEEYADDFSRIHHFYKKVYDPVNNPETLLQLTTLVTIFNITEGSQAVRSLPFLRKLEDDMVMYVKNAYYFDYNYVPLCFYYCSRVPEEPRQELLFSLLMKANKHFDSFSLQQLSQICIYSFLLNASLYQNRLERQAFFKLLDEYFIKNENTLLQLKDRKVAQSFIIGYTATKQGDLKVWRIIEQFLTQSLEKEIQDIKGKTLSTHPITKNDIRALIHALVYRKIQTKQLWQCLIKLLVYQLSSKTFTLQEVANIVNDLSIIRLSSPKLIQLLLQDFVSMKYTEHDLRNLGLRVAVNYLYSMNKLSGSIDNKEFFHTIKQFITNYIDQFTKYQLMKLLDIYKFNQNFRDQNLKNLLENQLEVKLGQNVIESEEEELKSQNLL